jgi:putative endonuclease
MEFFYTYVLRCSDGCLYIGSTSDLRRRLQEHTGGQVDSTRSRLPVKLTYFEGCLSLAAAREREQQLKTGYGRAYLKRRLAETTGG